MAVLPLERAPLDFPWLKSWRYVCLFQQKLVSYIPKPLLVLRIYKGPWERKGWCTDFWGQCERHGIYPINTECGHKKLTASGYPEKGCRGKQRFPRCSVIFPPAPYGQWRRHHATESPGQHECGLCIPALRSCFELLIAAGGKSGQMKEVNSSSMCYLFQEASADDDVERSQEDCSRCKPLPHPPLSAPRSHLWVMMK